MAAGFAFGIGAPILFALSEKNIKIIKKPLFYVYCVLLAVLGAFCAHKDGMLSALSWQSLVLFLTDCTAEDIKTRTVKNKSVLIFVIIGAMLCLLSMDLNSIISSVVGGGIIPGVLLLCRLISKGGIGGGDIKMCFVTAIFTGFAEAVSIIFVSMGIIVVWGIVMLITRNKKATENIPMAPFLLASVVVNAVL